MILNGPGDDLGGGGASAIDEDHERHIEVRARAVRDVVVVRPVGAAAGVDDERALLQELVGDGDRLVQEPAGVVPEVQHELLRALHLEFHEVLVQLVLGGFREIGDAQIADVVLQEERVEDASEVDLVANDGEIERLVVARPRDGDGDFASFRTAKALHRVVELHTAGLFAFDLRDHVARADAEAIGGRSLEGGDDGEASVPHLDRDSETVIAPLLALLELRVLLLRQEVGVRVERPEHSPDGGVDQLLGVDLGDVLVFDHFEHVCVAPEELGVPIGLGLGSAPEESAYHGAGDDQRERDSEG